MLMNTHYTIARSVLDSLDDSKSFFISNRNFIYGNIKPDIFSKYKLKKHYVEESFDMILDKINHISSFSLNNVSKYFSVSMLSQELGVICHFLCDFFCKAHNERWEFKHSINRHMAYEKRLSSVAKKLDLTKLKSKSINNDFKSFFYSLFKEYEKKKSYVNDLKYATCICKSTINYILDNILANTVISYQQKAVCN